MPPPRSTQSVRSIWRKLTQPAPAITDAIQQRQSRLLASMLLVLAALSVFSILTQPLYRTGTTFQSPELYVSIASLVVEAAAWLINRRGRYAMAATLTAVTITAGLFSLAVPHPGDPGEITWLYYLVVPVLIANVFLPVWATTALVAACLVGMAALPLVTPLSDDNLPVIFVFSISSLILILSRHQQRLESERKRSLADSERRLRLITDSSFDIITQLDGEGTVRYVSPAVFRTLGYTPEELIGHPIRYHMSHPDDRSEVAEWFRQLVERKQTARVQFRYQHKDGHYIWLETIARPLAWVDDPAGGYVLVSRDITERKRFDDALKEREERYHTLAANLPDVTVFLFDHDLRYLAVEGAAPLEEQGIAPQQFLGRTLFDVAPESGVRYYEPIYRAALDGQELVTERQVAGRVYELHGLPVKDERGAIRAGMLVARDVTAVRQVQEQRLELAVERERALALQQFVDRAAAHDLRTPLTIMKTSAYLLERIEDPDKRARYIENLNVQIDHLGRVFENILAMSQIYRDEAEFHRAPLSLNQVIREVLMNQQGLVAEKSLMLEFTAETDLPNVLGDEYALQQVITHLVRNAIQFTPEGGRITVRTYRREGKAVAEIEDTGVGISEHDLPLIFDPFYRADKARQFRMGEMGLGLTIVKRLVELHGGQIEVESQPNRGSIFRVLLATETAPGDLPTQEAKTV